MARTVLLLLLVASSTCFVLIGCWFLLYPYISPGPPPSSSYAEFAVVPIAIGIATIGAVYGVALRRSWGIALAVALSVVTAGCMLVLDALVCTLESIDPASMGHYCAAENPATGLATLLPVLVIGMSVIVTLREASSRPAGGGTWPVTPDGRSAGDGSSAWPTAAPTPPTAPPAGPIAVPRRIARALDVLAAVLAAWIAAMLGYIGLMWIDGPGPYTATLGTVAVVALLIAPAIMSLRWIVRRERRGAYLAIVIGLFGLLLTSGFVDELGASVESLDRAPIEEPVFTAFSILLGLVTALMLAVGLYAGVRWPRTGEDVEVERLWPGAQRR